MRHAFVVDPLASFQVTADTTLVFMREAARRGHEVHSVEVSGLSIGPAGRPQGRLARTRLRDAASSGAGGAADAAWYTLEPAALRALDEFDVVWMRKDPPVDLDFVRVTQILTLVAPPTLVVNDPRALLEVDEKLFALRFPELVPESIVARDIDELLAFRDKLGGEMVIKPIGGCGGLGVFHLTPNDRNTRSILEMATDQGRRFQVAQRYLPEVREGDKRIILLEGEPIGAVLRVPQGSEARANFHVGGRAVKTVVSDREREIAARLRPELVERGILFAGIDVIGGFLTEVNVTSPTGVQEINRLDGVTLERQVLDAVERRLTTERRGS